MCRQLCMPPQQISPSAASRSPKSSAMSQASRNVSAIVACSRLDSWPTPQGSLPNRYESLRTDGRPSSRKLAADHASFAHLCEKASALLFRRPSPSRRRWEATLAQPGTRRPDSRGEYLSAKPLQIIVGGIDIHMRQRTGTNRRRRNGFRPPLQPRSDPASCPDRWRFGAVALADQTRPHRVVKRWTSECACSLVAPLPLTQELRRRDFPDRSASEITSGSVVAEILDTHPDLRRRLRVTKNSSWVISPKRIMDGVGTACLPMLPWPCVRINP